MFRTFQSKINMFIQCRYHCNLNWIGWGETISSETVLNRKPYPSSYAYAELLPYEE